eukprot:TRINITY_DN16008_c0_g1_i1.p1 TRINITY_DN16008_c0_g1~~TRINITY_DN16008_c0_g1_i1.p1  ORF type:complete len:365 (-),score=98.36 TRINITY_DN16008_c0_g1_i1:3-1097(-)
MAKKKQNAEKQKEEVDKKRERAALRRQRAHTNKEDSRWRSNFVRLSEQLLQIGLSIHDVPGDGNCLFRSFGDQLFQDQTKHSEVRQKIVQHMAQNPDDFQPFVEDDEPYEEYLSDVKKDGTWGGHLEIQAACRVFNVNVIIHQLDTPAWEIINFENPRTKVIHLSYHDGQHYASVRAIDPKDIPVPTTLGANSNSKEDQKKNEEEQKISLIVRSTKVQDVHLIKKTLSDMENDVDATIEALIAISNTQPSQSEAYPPTTDENFDPSNYQTYEIDDDLEMQQLAFIMEDSLNFKPSESNPTTPMTSSKPKREKPKTSQLNKSKKPVIKKADAIRQNNLSKKGTPPPPPPNPSSKPSKQQAKAIRI